MTSIRIPLSSNPNKDLTKTKWPELLIGKNSVNPWIKPNKNMLAKSIFYS